jgi:signal transduction histidine kinase
VRTEKLYASTGVRLSFIYSGLLIAAFSVAIALTWIAARSAAESDLRDRIELEGAALEAEILDEGIDAAVAAIAARVERPGALEYWLIDPAGRVLAGDLPAMATPDGWHRVELSDTVDGAENRDELLVLTVALPDGTRLSVGDDLRRAESVRDAVLRSLLWIGLVTVVLGIVVGTFVTRRSLTQMDALTSIMSEVAEGRLDARILPRHGMRPNDLDRLGDSVNRMLDQIDSLVRNLRRVSSDVAHDLRTPLSHLQQRLETARTANTAQERLAAIEAADDKIAEVLQAFDAILRLAEIEAGAARSRFVDVDIAALVDRLADAYGPDVEASGRTLHVDRRDHASIRGDSDLLAQALANLVENAMNHTPAGTQITVSAFIEGSSLLLAVADNGPGIPPERRAEVLLPYSRLDQSRSTAGFGLGLSIVAAIARVHDAQLRLDDNRPGLRVTIAFPLNSA